MQDNKDQAARDKTLSNATPGKIMSMLAAGVTLAQINAVQAQPGDRFEKNSIYVGVSPIKQRTIPLNAKCPCGSGKKYKRCHLAIDAAQTYNG